MDKSKLYYFASPYSHKNKLVEVIRYELTIATAAKLTKQGYRLLEPIAMCHEQSSRYELPGGYEFWQTRDRGFIKICDAIMVLKLKGWDVSVGVTDEIEYAKSLGKPVIYLDPDKINNTILKEVFKLEEIQNALY
jgi:hypothetical protein